MCRAAHSSDSRACEQRPAQQHGARVRVEKSTAARGGVQKHCPWTILAVRQPFRNFAASSARIRPAHHASAAVLERMPSSWTNYDRCMKSSPPVLPFVTRTTTTAAHSFSPWAVAVPGVSNRQTRHSLAPQPSAGFAFLRNICSTLLRL